MGNSTIYSAALQQDYEEEVKEDLVQEIEGNAPTPPHQSWRTYFGTLAGMIVFTLIFSNSSFLNWLSPVSSFKASFVSGSVHTEMTSAGEWEVLEEGSKLPYGREVYGKADSLLLLEHPNKISLWIKGPFIIDLSKNRAFSYALLERFHAESGEMLIDSSKYRSHKPFRISVGDAKHKELVMDLSPGFYFIKSETELATRNIQAYQGIVKIYGKGLTLSSGIKEQQAIYIHEEFDEETPSTLKTSDYQYFHGFPVQFSQKIQARNQDKKMELTGPLVRAPEKDASASAGEWDWLGSEPNVRAYFTHNGADGKVVDVAKGEVVFSYDVRGEGTHAGLRLKNKLPDLSQYEALSLEMLPVEGFEFPNRFHLELKSEGRVVRVLHAKDVTPKGEPLQFEFHVPKPGELSEIILSVKNTTLTSSSQAGAFRLSSLRVLPKSPQ